MRVTERVRQIEGIICKAAGINQEELYGKERTRPMADARHAIWLILYEHVGYSYNDIAAIYHKDHTTVAHGVKRMKRTPVHQNVLKAINEIDSKLLLPIVTKRELKSADSWFK